MKRTEFTQRAAGFLKRQTQVAWLGVLGLAAALAQPALATDALYYNNEEIRYPGTVDHAPVIDATNFVNDGTIVINSMSYLISQPFFETSGTLNYTNNGNLTANTGFRFSTRSPVTGFRTTAASFYNAGEISCGSADNVGDVFSGSLYIYSGYNYYPQCIVDATNIVNPGLIDTGFGGLIRISGQTVDLSRSTLNIESASYYSGIYGSIYGSIYSNMTANVSGTGTFGLNTNYWNPGTYLGASNAYSAYFDIAPYHLYLTNSTAYIDVASSGSDNVIRAVFIQDDSGDDVSYNVYFYTAGIGLGDGNVTIEWVGSSTDSVTGGTFQNYLYLNNNYLRSTATNLYSFNGIPDNFTFTTSDTPLLTGEIPAAAGFTDGLFGTEAITNRYAYVNAELMASSISLNDNPTHSPTNLIGRVEITATEELDLSLARITGQNFLSVHAPKQFDGTAGAAISAPYSDFDLGDTNGFLNISNLISSSLPNWSGTVKAWSTAWLGTNALGGTNDYRVIIVGSKLSPTSLARVQDMILHATNSVVISDTLHVMRHFTSDARNLTLTTNFFGEGAASPAGELNLELATKYSWSDSLPNLRNLTNNGAIRVENFVQFIGSTSTVTVIPPSSFPTLAAGLLSDALTNRHLLTKKNNVEPKSTVQIGTNIYSFVNRLNNRVPNQVKIAGQFSGTMSNLIAAINHDAGAGTKYSKSTPTNPLAMAGPWASNSIVLTAKISGTYGNAIVTRTTSTNLTWNGHSTLYGGAEFFPGSTNTVTGTVPYENVINTGLIANNGTEIQTTNFVNSGIISNGLTYFKLNSLTTTMTDGVIVAGSDVTLTSGSIIASNVFIQAGRSLVVTATNLLTDGGVTNGSIWAVQSTNGTGGNGLIQRLKPAAGDLLGTTININVGGPNKVTANIWAGHNFGTNITGYTNNSAVGRLILDSYGATSKFRFTGASVSNALYVDYLELNGYATNFDIMGNLKALTVDANITIYFAQALINGDSVAEKLDGKNGGRLRWISSYAGHFSSTNLVYGGYTNTVNAALAISSTIDSDGDGIPNSSDPTPFPVPSPAPVLKVSLGGSTPPATGGAARPASASQPFVCIQWVASGGETYSLYYRTNLLAGDWMPCSNFAGYYLGDKTWVSNDGQSNSIVVPAEAGSSVTVRVVDGLTGEPQFYYQVRKP